MNDFLSPNVHQAKINVPSLSCASLHEDPKFLKIPKLSRLVLVVSVGEAVPRS